MIGIIGFGRFGQLTAQYLAKDFEVWAYNHHSKSAEIKNSGALEGSFEEVCGQKIIILAVPISHLEEVLQRMAPVVQADAVVVDVCSVKVLPLKWMHALLPPRVSILATHPMFGPDSAADSLKDRKIFIVRERVAQTTYDRIVTYLKNKGLIVIEGSAEEHDRQIAITLALTHFIGRSLSKFGAEPLDVDTEGYKRLLHILGVVENDTWQLFVDMHRYNPFAKVIRETFMDAMQSISQRLDQRG